MSDKKHILKGLFILFGFLFLINIIPADSKLCWVESNSADCLINGGQFVMELSDSTNAHGALAEQGTFAPVLCCNFGTGNTTCTADNKILGLSSSTNAHAESPSLVDPNYNTFTCYSGFEICRRTELNCDLNEIEVLYISNKTNAHIEGAGLGTQNYDSKICCAIDKNALCELTSAEWEDEEAYEGTNVEAIVYGEHCADVEISFEVFRGGNTCEDIGGCVNPSIVVFGSGSNSESGIWNACPYNDEEYSFIASVVGGSSSVESNNTLLVTPDECDGISSCRDYTQGYCEADGCEVAGTSAPEDIYCDEPDTDCFCYWDETEGCDAGWDAPSPIEKVCGDGIVDRPNNNGWEEDCDPDDGTSIFLSGEDSCVALTTNLGMNEYTGGDLDCRTDCRFDITGCIDGEPVCGDNVVNQWWEVCDGTHLGGETCKSLGFDGGTLSCTANCQLNKSGCFNIEDSDGDGLTDDVETNTGVYVSPSDTGTDPNNPDTDGDGFSDGDEVNQGTDPNNPDDHPQPTIVTNKVCGDGIVDIPNDGNINEQCDPNDLTPEGEPVFLSGQGTCVDLTTNLGMDNYTEGTLDCRSNCMFDVRGCIGDDPVCGDNVVNELSEECDGNDLQGKSCSYWGHEGTLSCTANCKFDISGCTGEDWEIPLIGNCKYTSSTEGADCSEEGVEFLTYSWTATWTWAPENEGESPPCETGYIFWNETGKCYYDPNGKSTQCASGQKTVPCPAQLKLPFFGPYNIIATMILITLIYIFLILKRHKK
jgi:hypothetical protein